MSLPSPADLKPSRPPVRFTFNMPSFMMNRQTSANKALILDAPPTPTREYSASAILNSPNYRININQSQSTLSQRTPRQRSGNQSPQLDGRATSANVPIVPPIIRTSSASMSMMSPASVPRTPHSTRSEPGDNSFTGRWRSRLLTAHRNTAALIGIYTRPWLQSRYTLLVMTFMLVVFSLISLYFTAFGLYLTHYLHTTTTFPDPTPSDPTHVKEIVNQCSTPELSGFLLFVLIRSVVEIVLLVWRALDRSLWINHWPSLKFYQKAFLATRSLMTLCTVMFVVLACRWIAQASSDMNGRYVPGQIDCVQLSYEVVVGLTAYEIAGLVAPLFFLIPLSFFFNWKLLSYFVPFLPLTPDMFEKPIAGLSAEEIKRLPSALYDPQVHTSDKCSICLGEFTANQPIRVLQCNHVFNTECIDEWLTKKRTCPLCVQIVEPVSSKRRFSLAAISRTRRDSVTRSRNSASHNDHSDDESQDQHDFGLRHDDASNQSPAEVPPVSIEMSEQSESRSE